MKSTLVQKPEKPISKLTVVMDGTARFSRTEVDTAYTHVFTTAWTRRFPIVFGENGLPIKSMILYKGGKGTPSPDIDDPTEGLLIISPKSASFKTQGLNASYVSDIAYTISFKLVSRGKGAPTLWTGEASYYSNPDFQRMLPFADQNAIGILETLRSLNLATVNPGTLSAK